MNPFGKGNTGSRTSNALVTEALVRNIRKLAAEGQPTRNIADAYGLAVETVRKIIRRDSWKWVSEVVDWDKAGAMPVQSNPTLDAEIAASAQRMQKLIKADVDKVDEALDELHGRKPPPSPLDGGDVEDEACTGLSVLHQKALELGVSKERLSIEGESK